MIDKLYLYSMKKKYF